NMNGHDSTVYIIRSVDHGGTGGCFLDLFVSHVTNSSPDGQACLGMLLSRLGYLLEQWRGLALQLSVRCPLSTSLHMLDWTWVILALEKSLPIHCNTCKKSIPITSLIPDSIAKPSSYYRSFTSLMRISKFKPVSSAK